MTKPEPMRCGQCDQPVLDNGDIICIDCATGPPYTEAQLSEAEHTRAILRATAKGFDAGQKAAVGRLPALPQSILAEFEQVLTEDHDHLAVWVQAHQEAIARGLLSAIGRLPALDALLQQWRVAAERSRTEAALADDGDGAYALRHRVISKAVLVCVAELEAVVAGLRADPAVKEPTP